MKRAMAILCSLALILGALGAALAVTYTEDGGMVVGGDGSDDFSDVEQSDPGVTYTTVILPGENTDVMYDDEGNIIEPGPRPTYAPGEILDVTITGEDGEEQAVTRVNAGTLFSQVSIGRRVFTVASSELHYETDPSVTEARRYGIINAKRTGYATMHTRPKVKSDVVGRCTTNRVVLVLNVGKGYTKVWCEGNVGYVKTASLLFLPPADAGTAQALMSYKGRTNSRNTINIRQNGKSTSRILGDIACGAQLTVFSTSEDGWVEVEVNGWRAWVQGQYVTYLTEDTTSISAEAEPGTTPAPMLASAEAENEYTLTFVYEEPQPTDHTGSSGGGAAR